MHVQLLMLCCDEEIDIHSMRPGYGMQKALASVSVSNDVPSLRFHATVSCDDQGEESLMERRRFCCGVLTFFFPFIQ